MIYRGYIQTHLRLNRIYLQMIGLWPYQKSKLIRIQFFLCFGILTTYILSQLFFTSKYTADIIFKMLFNMLFIAIGMINYVSFYINSKTVKYLIDQIQCSYDRLKDDNEIAIMDEYGNKTKRITAMLIVFLACSLFGVYGIQFWPCVLNLLVNKTRSIHMLHFNDEYLFDQKRYFYLILLLSNITILIFSFVMFSTGTLLLAYGQHICGMFKIASYRIQHAMKLNMSQSTKLWNKNPIWKRIIYAIDVHRKAMQFADTLMSTFAMWFSVLIIIEVICTSINLLRIFLTLSSRYPNVEELSIQFFTLAFQYFYMFMSNFVAQDVMDHNNHVFVTVYNIKWYAAPLQIQKMILFLLLKGTKPYNLHLSSFFVGSLQGFTSLMSASISYFTVMYSVQQ